MQPIIDMHAHILPGIDDGSRNMDETIELLTMAYRYGIRNVIATPHHYAGRNNTDANEIRRLADKVQKRMSDIVADLHIYAGAELLYGESLIRELEEEKALTLAGSSYVLIEFHIGSTYETIYRAVRELKQSGYNPILAHVERYSCLRTQGRIEELIRTGAYMQMNYSGLISNLRYIADVRWCRRQILSNQIHFLGTDMHRRDFRPPKIQKALGWLQQSCDCDRFNELTYENPNHILNGGKWRKTADYGRTVQNKQ